jgi:hypothetical protein
MFRIAALALAALLPLTAAAAETTPFTVGKYTYAIPDVYVVNSRIPNGIVVMVTYPDLKRLFRRRPGRPRITGRTHDVIGADICLQKPEGQATMFPWSGLSLRCGNVGGDGMRKRDRARGDREGMPDRGA